MTSRQRSDIPLGVPVADSASAARAAGRPRLDYLDGIRACAALYVLLHHVWLTVFTSGKVEPTGVFRIGGVLNYGHFGVAVFIVVSGYSLALSTSSNGDRLKQGVGPFLARRFWRIVPTYWAALGLSLLLGLTLLRERTTGVWSYAVPFSGWDVAAHALLVHDLWHPSTVNYVLWSIAIEWHIYFVFPLLLAALRIASPALVLPAVIAGSLAVSLAMGSDERTALPSAFLVGCFTLGVAACRVVHRGGLFVRGRVVTLPWTVLAGTVLLGAGLAFAGGAPNAVADVGVAAAVALLLVAMGLGKSGVARTALSARPLVAVGAYSYSLYLLHPMVVQASWLGLRGMFAAPDVQVVVLTLTAVPGALMASWLFFLAVEHPFLAGSHVWRRAGQDTRARYTRSAHASLPATIG